MISGRNIHIFYPGDGRVRVIFGFLGNIFQKTGIVDLKICGWWMDFWGRGQFYQWGSYQFPA